MKNPSFSSFGWQNGLLYDYSANQFPTKLHALVGSEKLHLQKGSTYFVFQHAGSSLIDGLFPVPACHYAAVTGNNNNITGSADALAIIVERLNFAGMFVLGGPVEHTGRLKYIDGCTDSLLIPPVKFGDACLNHLHFPRGIDQTMHTHPSMRIGLVTKGHGECVTPFGNIPLFPGQIFIIHQEDGSRSTGIDGKDYPVGSHSFKTFGGEGMDVIAYHPDSDFGPKDEEHPMINRTIVNGISAKHIDEIRTK
jgi:hypothetical protein